MGTRGRPWLAAAVAAGLAFAAYYGSMEARIFGEIAQATGLRAGAIQVDCRTTLCRVLLTNPGSAPNPRYSSFNELVASFGLEEKWLLAVPDDNGTPINFAYIERSDGTTTRSELP